MIKILEGIYNFPIASLSHARSNISPELLSKIFSDNIQLSIYNDVGMTIECAIREVYKDSTTTTKDVIQDSKTEEQRRVIESIKTFPSSSWEHLKKDYFPKWLLKLCPVKYDVCEISFRNINKITNIYNRTIHVTRKHCPHINLPPNDQLHISFLIDPK